MDHVNAPAQPYSDCWSPLTPALRGTSLIGENVQKMSNLYSTGSPEQVLPPASRQVFLSEADLSTDDEDLLQMRLISGLIPCFPAHTAPLRPSLHHLLYIHPHAENDGHLIKTV